MIITASVRPRGLKRGTTDKKLAQLLGFEESVGLAKICGRIELSATRANEFYFLKELYNALMPCEGTKSTRIIVEIDGKEVAVYGH